MIHVLFPLIRRISLTGLVAGGLFGLLSFEEATAAILAPTTVMVSTADNQIDPRRLNQGWWSDMREQDATSDNYFTGFLETTNPANQARGYFSFYVGDVAGLVSAASLHIELGTSTSPDPTETIEFRAVSTPTNLLNSRNVVDLSIFEDLGTGTSYGSIEVTVGSDANTILEVPLNQAAIDAINSTTDRYFSVGASLPTLSDGMVDEFVFGNTGNNPNFLVLTVVPEPGSAALASSALFVILRRRRG